MEIMSTMSSEYDSFVAKSVRCAVFRSFVRLQKKKGQNLHVKAHDDDTGFPTAKVSSWNGSESANNEEFAIHAHLRLLISFCSFLEVGSSFGRCVPRNP